jgi:hypothetical protein
MRPAGIISKRLKSSPLLPSAERSQRTADRREAIGRGSGDKQQPNLSAKIAERCIDLLLGGEGRENAGANRVGMLGKEIILTRGDLMQ